MLVVWFPEEHTLFLKWADTHTHAHTRTATCRALGYIGTTTDVLTLTDTPLSNTSIRNHPL
jgi:hypothetical protein